MTALKQAARLAWTVGSPQWPACVIRAPWWANRVTWLGIGVPPAIAMGLLTPADMPFHQVLLIAVSIALPVTAGMWVTEKVVERRTPWHMHCDDCGVCSLSLGVPGGDSLTAADREASERGWYLERPGDEDTATCCPSCRPCAGFPVLVPEVWR